MKRSHDRLSLWKRAQSCSEAGVRSVVEEWSATLSPGDRIVLDGPMGAGKSTLARFLLESLGSRLPPEGSPTFAVAHEYPTALGRVVHIDVYRLEDDAELEAAGVEAAVWETTESLVLVEWLTKFPVHCDALLERYRAGRVWWVELQFDSGDESRRDLTISVTRK